MRSPAPSPSCFSSLSSGIPKLSWDNDSLGQHLHQPVFLELHARAQHTQRSENPFVTLLVSQAYAGDQWERRRSQAETGLSNEILFVLSGPGLQFLEEPGFANHPQSKNQGEETARDVFLENYPTRCLVLVGVTATPAPPSPQGGVCRWLGLGLGLRSCSARARPSLVYSTSPTLPEAP